MMSEIEKLNGTPPEEHTNTSSEDEFPIDASKDDSSPKLVAVSESPKKDSSVSPKAIVNVESPLNRVQKIILVRKPKLVSGASPKAISKIESLQTSSDDKFEVTDAAKSPEVPGVDESPKKASDAFSKAFSEDKSPIVAKSPKVVDESKSPPALLRSKTPDVLSDDKPLEVPSLDKCLKSPEKRMPRLNRRGIYLEDFNLEEPKLHKDVKDSELEKIKPKSNIISLASVKKSSTEINIPNEKKKIVLKRKPSTSFDVEKKAESISETSPQAPPKKKHKPITWP